jgi:hypothetical protein
MEWLVPSVMNNRRYVLNTSDIYGQPREPGKWPKSRAPQCSLRSPVAAVAMDRQTDSFGRQMFYLKPQIRGYARHSPAFISRKLCDETAERGKPSLKHSTGDSMTFSLGRSEPAHSDSCPAAPNYGRMIITAEIHSASESLYERSSYLHGVGVHAVLWLLGSSSDEPSFLYPQTRGSRGFLWREATPLGH